MATKPVSLQQEALAIHYVRLAAEVLRYSDVIFCNAHKLPKLLPIEKQTMLMLELISREPRPFVEYLESGCQRLRRAEIIGEGTKKSPYKGQWRNDYYL